MFAETNERLILYIHLFVSVEHDGISQPCSLHLGDYSGRMAKGNCYSHSIHRIVVAFDPGKAIVHFRSKHTVNEPHNRSIFSPSIPSKIAKPRTNYLPSHTPSPTAKETSRNSSTVVQIARNGKTNTVQYTVYGPVVHPKCSFSPQRANLNVSLTIIKCTYEVFARPSRIPRLPQT